MDLSDFLELFYIFLFQYMLLSSNDCTKPWRYIDKFHLVLANKEPGVWCQRQGSKQKTIILWYRDVQLWLLWGKGC